jgi:hypothetical protein
VLRSRAASARLCARIPTRDTVSGAVATRALVLAMRTRAYPVELGSRAHADARPKVCMFGHEPLLAPCSRAASARPCTRRCIVSLRDTAPGFVTVQAPAQAVLAPIRTQTQHLTPIDCACRPSEGGLNGARPHADAVSHSGLVVARAHPLVP